MIALKHKIVVNALEANSGDAFLFVSDVNRYWLTGFESSAGYVISTKSKVYLFLDKRYYQKAVDEIFDSKVEILVLSGGKPQVCSFLKNLQVDTVLVEKEYFSFDDYMEISDSIKTIINYPSDFLRLKKTEKEIEYVQKACDIVCETMNWIEEQLRPGLSEKEIALMVTCHMLELGASKNSFDPIVASGPNGAYPHHKPTDRIIQDNEFVTIDMGCIYKGYCSDLTRTYPVGTPNATLIKAYQTVFKSNQLGIQKASYDLTGKELDKICRDIISETEFKDYFVHGTGHGVGINVHETPYVSPAFDKLIQGNSIITIEPGIYIPGLGGIRIEDMVLVRKDKENHLMTQKAKVFVF